MGIGTKVHDFLSKHPVMYQNNSHYFKAYITIAKRIKLSKLATAGDQFAHILMKAPVIFE